MLPARAKADGTHSSAINSFNPTTFRWSKNHFTTSHSAKGLKRARRDEEGDDPEPVRWDRKLVASLRGSWIRRRAYRHQERPRCSPHRISRWAGTRDPRGSAMRSLRGER